MNPPSGLEATPPRGFPFINCPHCGKPLARFVFPPPSKVAQMAQLPQVEPIAPELADLTPLTGQQVDRRTAPTERLERPDEEGD